MRLSIVCARATVSTVSCALATISMIPATPSKKRKSQLNGSNTKSKTRPIRAYWEITTFTTFLIIRLFDVPATHGGKLSRSIAF